MRILIAGATEGAWQLARHLAMLPGTDVHLASADQTGELAVREVDGVTMHFASAVRRLPPLVVRQLAQRLRPDVVHGFGLGGDALGAVSSGRPHLLTPRLQQLTAAHRLLLRQADHVAVVSPYMREVVQPLARGRLHELPVPVAPDFFDVIPGTRPDHPPTLLAVANMAPRKRLDLAVRSLAVVRRDVPDARLRIAGHVGTEGAALLAELRDLARGLGVGDDVDFLGPVTEGRLLREYAEADVLLHTAADATSPLAITQAMAAGLPVVAADIPGVQHLVRHGITGLLAHTATPRGVAAAAVEALTDRESAGALGATARSLAHREFEPLGVARRARGVYGDIASARG